jgi:hypothetical protein
MDARRRRRRFNVGPVPVLNQFPAMTPNAANSSPEPARVAMPGMMVW